MISKLLEKLRGSKKRRDLFVAGQIKTGIPFQVRALRDKKDWTQAQLGAELGMTQTNVSRLESPGYGRLNITTLQRIASVFDVALIVRFVPFSELIRWTDNLSPEVMAPASFEEESPHLEKLASWQPTSIVTYARITEPDLSVFQGIGETSAMFDPRSLMWGRFHWIPNTTLTAGYSYGLSGRQTAIVKESARLPEYFVMDQSAIVSELVQ